MPPPEPTANEYLACQIGSWYPLFPKSSTFRTVILQDLPDPEFMQYLNADQVILPRGVKTSSALLEQRASSHGNDDDDDDECSDQRNQDEEEDNDDDGDDDDSTTRIMMEEMNGLSQRIEDAIQLLGGAVIPKLNWSSPKDAIWINGGTMECRRAGDVLLLLKSSDFCAHDVLQLQQQQQQQPPGNNNGSPLQSPSIPIAPTLALRKWANLHPSQEYRCFCRERELVAICQRHFTEYWPHLSQDDHLATMRRVIQDFFRTVVLVSLTGCCCCLSSFVFDVYVDRKHRVWLVDLNVWGTSTDSLLFDWDELVDDKTITTKDGRNGLEFRVVEHAVNVQAHPLSNYKAPVDVLDLVSDRNSQQFREFMSMCERPSTRTEED
jgi:D123